MEDKLDFSLPANKIVSSNAASFFSSKLKVADPNENAQ
jgi:hypothetical protein